MFHLCSVITKIWMVIFQFNKFIIKKEINVGCSIMAPMTLVVTGLWGAIGENVIKFKSIRFGFKFKFLTSFIFVLFDYDKAFNCATNQWVFLALIYLKLFEWEKKVNAKKKTKSIPFQISFFDHAWISMNNFELFTSEKNRTIFEGPGWF